MQVKYSSVKTQMFSKSYILRWFNLVKLGYFKNTEASYLSRLEFDSK